MELESSKSLGLSKRHSYQKTRGHAGETGGGRKEGRNISGRWRGGGGECWRVSLDLGGV